MARIHRSMPGSSAYAPYDPTPAWGIESTLTLNPCRVECVCVGQGAHHDAPEAAEEAEKTIRPGTRHVSYSALCKGGNVMRTSVSLFATCLLITGLGYALEPACNALGTELTHLRTEYSRTYVLEDGKFTTEIHAAPIHRLDQDGDWQTLSTDEVYACSVFWGGTGSVTSNTKTSGSLGWKGRSSMQQRTHAWMKFNLDLLPQGSIEQVSLDYFLTYLRDNAATLFMVTHIRMSVDPITATANQLFNAITNGDEMLDDNWQSAAPVQRHIEIPLGSQAIAKIQEGLGVDPPWVAFGFRDEDRYDYLEGNAAGYSDGYASRPVLRITYTPPPYYDVGVAAIVSPVGSVPPNTTVIPKATWRNYGNQQMTFTPFCCLTNPLGIRVHERTLPSSTLDPNEAVTLEFEGYNVGEESGQWSVMCSTFNIPMDQNPANDSMLGHFTVTEPGPYTDVQVTDVVAPSGTYEKNTPIIPTAKWKNNSNHVVSSFTAYFILKKPNGVRDYRQFVTVLGIEPTRETTLTFPEYMIGEELGTWTARCSTYTAGDENPNNDVLEETFQVVEELVRPDIGAISIVSPTGQVETSAVVIPRGKYRNYNDQPMDFTAFFTIRNPAGGIEYFQAVPVTALEGRTDTVVVFPDCKVTTEEGRWTTRCSTYSVDDINPANNACGGEFWVGQGQPSWPYGWVEVAKVPRIQSPKEVKDGAWLAVGPDKSPDSRLQTPNSASPTIRPLDPLNPVIYAAKGNKTTDFFKYTPGPDSGFWTKLWPIPAEEEGRPKPPSKGCKAISDNVEALYMTKGNNTLGFWRYDIAKDTWTMLLSVPEGPYRKRVKGGNDLEFIQRGDTGWVYLLKGYKTEFYRYNIQAGRWDLLPEVPYGVKPKYDKGSFIVYDKGNYIYAHQAKQNNGGYHYMFRYDVAADSWYTQPLRGMPVFALEGGRPAKKKKSGDGSAGAWFAENIYALKGGNTQGFFKYFPDGDSWVQLDTVPGNGSTGKKKRVKSGGDLVNWGNAFFALKGNKTFEFWRYAPKPPSAPKPVNQGFAIAARRIRTNGWAITVSPNPIASGFATLSYTLPRPAPLTVTVFDVAGRSVLRQAYSVGRSASSISLDLRKLSAGVYLVRLTADGYSASQKLVVQH